MKRSSIKSPSIRFLTVGVWSVTIRLLVVLVLHVVLAPLPVLADPDYGEGPVLYGLDPLLSGTSDPRLLGVDRLVILRGLKHLGVDPRKASRRRPSLENSFYAHFLTKSRVDLERRERTVEYDGARDLLYEYSYPTFFYLFPASQALPGGFTYYPPRPVGDPLVDLFVDELAAGLARRRAVGRILVRRQALDVAGARAGGRQEQGLINLTIPIKLPRTLEKIIGRGDKTKIKITGRERIAIDGKSTVVKPFVPNERVSSQSLFPTLDMQQELQVSLSGTIGEKIVIEVDYNSAQMGPDATKIKLMYQGGDDEVIKTIETGDVGLTLPGSQLLGYSSNKSGLFGIKVTGQVGRADFTVVASKQKAESSAKTFNSKGGQVSENITLSANYLNNRFFRFDLPYLEPAGRNPLTEIIDLASIKIFKLMGPGEFGPNDIPNVAAYIDSSGFRNWNGGGMDFTNPEEYGRRWREVTTFDPLLNADGGLEAIDLRASQLDEDVLAVVYTVVDLQGNVIAYVGDDPGRVAGPSQLVIGQGEELFYRMKMLKAPVNAKIEHLFNYVLRNIYSLGGTNIDPTTFDLRIESTDSGLIPPDLDENGIPYIQIFGLDIENPSRVPGADGIVDAHNTLIFDLNKGLLKFPLDFPQPFSADEAQYAANANDPAFSFASSAILARDLEPRLYDYRVLPRDYADMSHFRLVATHASAASSFNLNASNIQDGSEVVTLDGRVLVNGVDYEIDYLFGEIQLKGDAANLSADSKIGVTYSFSPFFGGGNTSLAGFSLGYDLGKQSKLATTWLYQTEAIVGEKAKLGEEPSKNLVGNINLQHTFKPHFLTTVANVISRHNTERESSLQFSGEMAVSLPNPNTKGRVFLEDFEGVDASDLVGLNRISWSWASAPFLGDNAMDSRTFDPEDRVGKVRWFLPKERTLRRYLNPLLVNQERNETQPTMDLYLGTDSGTWQPENWGGIMRGISRTGLDLSKSQFIEVWLNDQEPDVAFRSGKVHIDFGYINEDGFWPDTGSGLEVGTYQKEDVNSDGVWVFEEDDGLDHLGEAGPQGFDAAFEVNGDAPYPFINGTARNNREDDEDLNGNTRLDVSNGYFTTTIDLATTPPLVDVVNDYGDVQDLVNGRIAWRKYRIPIGNVDQVSVDELANIQAITHVRIWYENDQAQAPAEVHLQLSELRFVGSRWEREGVRRIDGETLLSRGERLAGEEFFLGEVNNKENPAYRPPFRVEEINNIPAKEQSLVLNFQNIEQGHLVRASKQVSSRGDDYTNYRNLSWYWYNEDHANADLDLFFRVGADTLNYYEVDYRFADSATKVGWHKSTLNLGELSNAKNGEMDARGHLHSTIRDATTGDVYRVVVVGRPDLRHIKRYYFGVANFDQVLAATGRIYLNDVRLEDVKRDIGVAQRAGVRLNMADVIKADFDWKNNDADFHGLDKNAGSGINFRDWTFNSSLNLNDFIPTGGFRLPFNVSRRQLVQRPKYLSNSDVEILDVDVRNRESTVETSERFSSRLSHAPSQAAVLRYVVDPWVVQVNGSRGRTDGPLERRRNQTLAGSVNYDLRITGKYAFGLYPVLKYIPLVRSFVFLPRKLAFGGNFTSSKNRSESIAENGIVTPRQTTNTRPATFTASMDYQPLAILDLSANAKSERDMLRPRDVFGLNVGQENRRSYDLRMTFTLPKSRGIGGGKLMAPVRAVLRQAVKMRPSLQFTGNFADVHNPGIRQPDDPVGIRSLNNAGKWDLRVDVPVGAAFKAIFPEKKFSRTERDRLVSQQAALEQQNARRAGRGRTPIPAPSPVDPNQETNPGTAPGNLDLTPEEQQQREYERLLQRAEDERAQADERHGRSEPEAESQASPTGGKRVNPLIVFKPLLNLLRNTTPIKMTYTKGKGSSYTRLNDTAPFWYLTGLVNQLDLPSTDYAAFGFDERSNLALSTTSKISRAIALDVKYGTSSSLRNQIGSISENYKQDWPDAQLSLSGLEKWRIFGGHSGDREGGWFRSSTLNVSYKRSHTVNNFTATSYNPKLTTTISPRWTMNFHSGLSASLNATLTDDNSSSNGVSTVVKRSRVGVNVKHQFRADSFLAKLGLYRPGASQSVNMDVDFSYKRNRTDRLNPTGIAAAPTGTAGFDLTPRFSVQVTRNLNGAVRFTFSRSKNIATNRSTTSLGLGLEATFVF